MQVLAFFCIMILIDNLCFILLHTIHSLYKPLLLYGRISIFYLINLHEKVRFTYYIHRFTC